MNINEIKQRLQEKTQNIKVQPPKMDYQMTSPVKNAVPKDKPALDENSIEKIVAKLLIPNQDYGVIQGCRKPSLLKSGAEKLSAHFDFRTSIEIIHRYEDYDKSLVSYEVKVSVMNSDGKLLAEGVGSANSRERKFLKGDFFSQINTVLKIAKKRAFVDGILTATGSSSLFTQDMEDIADNR